MLQCGKTETLTQHRAEAFFAQTWYGFRAGLKWNRRRLNKISAKAQKKSGEGSKKKWRRLNNFFSSLSRVNFKPVSRKFWACLGKLLNLSREFIVPVSRNYWARPKKLSCPSQEMVVPVPRNDCARPNLDSGLSQCILTPMWHRGQNTVKFVQNEKYSAKSADFLRFLLYLCHVIDDFACLDLQH